MPRCPATMSYRERERTKACHSRIRPAGLDIGLALNQEVYTLQVSEVDSIVQGTVEVFVQ